MKNGMARLAAAIFLGVLMALQVHAADVVRVCGQCATPGGESEAELASRFCGLTFEEVPIGKPGDAAVALRALREKNLIAAVISSDALRFLDPARARAALRRPSKMGVPLLIDGLSSDTPPNILMKWSGGALRSSSGPVAGGPGVTYQFSDLPNITRQLAGQQIPVGQSEAWWLTPSSAANVHTIITLKSEGDDFPLFVMTSIGHEDLFLLSRTEPVGKQAVSTDDPLPEFAGLVPLLIFLRYAGGDRVWHAPVFMADLVIDDAWLIEPYGSLDYRKLLREMQEHNFHTSIAFIPYNYNRNRPSVVSIFREHPDRYSVCIHGNNHDHQEFYGYERDPLSAQEADIQQGLARMEKFKALTGIPYSLVMVWPWERMPPAGTLRAMKRYNFLADVNTNPVPMGSAPPTDPLFPLRPQSLRYANFLTIKRYPFDTLNLRAKVAVSAFLGNPMIFYAHEELFAGGIGAFDGVADYVNHIAPKAKWASLGFIARHLYLERVDSDGDYEVMAFSPELDIENSTGLGRTYHIEKPESFAEPIASVSVDGQDFPWQRDGNLLALSLHVAGGQAVHVRITYKNRLDLQAVNIRKTPLDAIFLRCGADFRDLVLSRFALGRAIIGAYYGPRRPELLGASGIMLVVGAILAARWLRAKR